MKGSASIALFIVGLALLAASIAALPVAMAQQLPDWNDEYLNDFAGMFSAGEASQLRTLLVDVREQTTAQVVLVTVESVEPLEPSQYATELFTKWGVGDKEKDNGLLMLYAKKEKKFWVTTGYGLEGILPDSKIGRMLDESYVPLRDAGNVTTGMIAFAGDVVDVIIANKDEVLAGNAGGDSFLGLLSDPFSLIFSLLFFVPFIFFAFFIAIAAVVARLSRPKCKTCGQKMKFVKMEGSDAIYRCPNGHTLKKKVVRTAYAGGFAAGGMSHGGFGGGGFGGGGFGGGGSGGGGAGR